jgi:hypothetical protein
VTPGLLCCITDCDGEGLCGKAGSKQSERRTRRERPLERNSCARSLPHLQLAQTAICGIKAPRCTA